MSLSIRATPIQADTQFMITCLRQMPQAVFLDSASLANGQRYSFLGYAPTDVVALQNTAHDQTTHLELLNAFLTPKPYIIHYPDEKSDPNIAIWKQTEPPFFGGPMGYIGYNAFDDSPNSHDTRPRLWLGWFSNCIVIDHLTNTAMHYEISPEEKMGLPWGYTEALEGRLKKNYHVGPPEWSMTQQAFESAVRQGQHHIHEGDCYQLNLSHRISRKFSGDPISLYEDMRKQDPQPFGAVIKTNYGHTLSFSPEQFFQVQQGHISTSPIKGTARRSNDPAEDQILADTLFACPKNDAELMMIVDLLRNDIGQCCEIGSVHVPTQKALHSFAHVHHLIGTIQGKLRETLSPAELLHALFPGGSITGAPKRRVRELIAEIETVPRHVYTGSIGYWGLGGAVNTNIAIRTCYLDGDTLHYHTGAGITADSDPTSEWEETLAKAKVFLGV
jgi:para-aminobenzoate synthetase component I